jgi:hypothetical protein
MECYKEEAVAGGIDATELTRLLALAQKDPDKYAPTNSALFSMGVATESLWEFVSRRLSGDGPPEVAERTAAPQPGGTVFNFEAGKTYLSNGIILSKNTRYAWHATLTGPNPMPEGQTKPVIRSGGSPNPLLTFGPTTLGKKFKIINIIFSDNSAADAAGIMIKGGCPPADGHHGDASAMVHCQRSVVEIVECSFVNNLQFVGGSGGGAAISLMNQYALATTYDQKVSSQVSDSHLRSCCTGCVNGSSFDFDTTITVAQF